MRSSGRGLVSSVITQGEEESETVFVGRWKRLVTYINLGSASKRSRERKFRFGRRCELRDHSRIACNQSDSKWLPLVAPNVCGNSDSNCLVADRFLLETSDRLKTKLSFGRAEH